MKKNIISPIFDSWTLAPVKYFVVRAVSVLTRRKHPRIEFLLAKLKQEVERNARL
jgi:hypothetical protein